MFEDTSVKDWIHNYDHGTPIDVWYDWFCNDRLLPAKTRRLARKVKEIAKSSKINQDTMYVWFKNNCPVNGTLYDDFRFADRETSDVVFTVIPRSGHQIEKGCALVYGRKTNGEWGELVKGTWRDVLNFFGV